MAQASAQRAETADETQATGSPGKKPVDKFHEGPGACQHLGER